MNAPRDNGLKLWLHAEPITWLLFGGFLLTVAALVAAGWVVASVGDSMAGLRNYNVNTAQFIRERNSIILVPPEWISGGTKGMEDSDAWWRWVIAESKARCGLVFILWLTGMSLLIRRHLRRRKEALPVEHPSNGLKLTQG